MAPFPTPLCRGLTDPRTGVFEEPQLGGKAISDTKQGADTAHVLQQVQADTLSPPRLLLQRTLGTVVTPREVQKLGLRLV